MNCAILAAGFGTRFEAGLKTLDEKLQQELAPIIESGGKCMLPLAGVPAISLWTDAIERELQISEVVIITNKQYYRAFHEWYARGLSSGMHLTLINNGRGQPERKNGAIKDLSICLDMLGDAETLVIAADMLYEMHLSYLIDEYNKRNNDLQLAYQELSEDIYSKGVMVLDASQKIVDFIEKPKGMPPSRYASAPVFVFQEGISSLVNQYLSQSQQHDLLGNFIEWMIHQRPMYAKVTEHRVYDLGTVESYLRCKDLGPENFFSKAE